MLSMGIKQRIKEYFFLNPTARLRVRQIERTVKVPFPSAVRYAKELVEEGILRKIEIGGIVLYSADRTSLKFLREKKLFNLGQLYSSGLIDYLIEEYHNPTIVLFGSYSLGEDIETSDIDLFIKTPVKKLKNLQVFNKKLQRELQIFQNKKVNDIKNKNLVNNIINGITLNGFLEVFNERKHVERMS